MGQKLGNIGKKLSLDHHSQGLLFMLGLILLAAQAWWALLGLFLYGIMHFQYCGGGTFQRTVRDEDQQDSLLDLLYIFIGTGGLLLMLVSCVSLSADYSKPTTESGRMQVGLSATNPSRCSLFKTYQALQH